MEQVLPPGLSLAWHDSGALTTKPKILFLKCYNSRGRSKTFPVGKQFFSDAKHSNWLNFPRIFVHSLLSKLCDSVDNQTY